MGNHFLLAPRPYSSLAEYRAATGADAVALARAAPFSALLASVAESGLRGRGGAGFPAGTKWKSIAFASLPYAHRGLQRGRGRAGHVQGSLAPAPEPVRRARRSADRGARGWRALGLRCPQGVVRTGDRAIHRGAGRAAGHRHARRCPRLHRARPGGVPVRRGESAARGDRGQRPAPAQRGRATLRARPLRHAGFAQPRPGQQCRDAGARALDRAPRGGLLPRGRNTRHARHPALHRQRRRAPAGSVRAARGHHAARALSARSPAVRAKAAS